MIQLLATPITDRTTPAELEALRRNLFDAIRELQTSLLARATVIKDVDLADGVETTVPHGIGRRVMVFISAVRGLTSTGRIVEIRDGRVRRDDYIVLKASGYGGTITVDLVVV